MPTEILSAVQYYDTNPQEMYSPKMILRSSDRVHSYPNLPSRSYHEPILRRRTDLGLLSPTTDVDVDEVGGYAYGHSTMSRLSSLKGRLVVRNTESQTSDRGSSISHQRQASFVDESSSSSSSSACAEYLSVVAPVMGGLADVDIREVSPSRPEFSRSKSVRSSPMVSPRQQEQMEEYFGDIIVRPRSKSPYHPSSHRHQRQEEQKQGFRYMDPYQCHSANQSWSELNAADHARGGDRGCVQPEIEEYDDDHDGASHSRQHLHHGQTYSPRPYAYGSEAQGSFRASTTFIPRAPSPPPPPTIQHSHHPHPAPPPLRRASTTPTGTIRVNGLVITPKAPPTSFDDSSSVKPQPKSAFFGTGHGWNPANPDSCDPYGTWPRAPPSSTGTGTIMRRGLRRPGIHRRYSDGDGLEGELGATQDECVRCNGQGCRQSLALEEYLRNDENIVPGMRELMERRRERGGG